MENIKQMDTSTIAYNYAIAKKLYDSSNKFIIENEIEQLINKQIQFILKFTSNYNTDKERFEKIKEVFFKNSINEIGQLGVPLINIENKLVPVTTINELINDYIPNLNFREKMTMVKNFISKKNDCIMYSVIIDLKKAINNNKVNDFSLKFPMLNINSLLNTLNLIEKILGFNIEETDKCYSDLNGSKELSYSGCKPLFQMMQNEYEKNPTISPITLCWLWHPLVYGVPYQDVVKLPSNNYVKKLSNSYEGNIKEASESCIGIVYRDYPIFPKLSQREKQFLKKCGENDCLPPREQYRQHIREIIVASKKNLDLTSP